LPETTVEPEVTLSVKITPETVTFVPEVTLGSPENADPIVTPLLKFPLDPTFKDLVIAIPPDKTTLPVETLVESVEFVTNNLPEVVVVPDTPIAANVEPPVTLKAPPTFNPLFTAIPPDTINAPVETLVESVVLVTVVKPDDVSVVADIIPVTVKLPPADTFPATFTLFPIPSPPDKTIAPVVDPVESTVEVPVAIPAKVTLEFTVTTPLTVRAPETVEFPPTQRVFVIDVPPLTMRHPLLRPVESVVFERLTTPVAFKIDTDEDPTTVVVPETVKFPPTQALLATPSPPAIVTLPVTALTESVVSDTVIPLRFETPVVVRPPVTLTLPVTLVFPPTKTLFAIARPPDTIKAPVLTLPVSTVDTTFTVSDEMDPAETFPVTSAFKDITTPPPMMTDFDTAIPPARTTPAVDTVCASVVFVAFKTPDNVTPAKLELPFTADKLPLTVTLPPTFRLRPTPTPPDVTRLPVVELVELVVEKTFSVEIDAGPATDKTFPT
jgi:hypothetical protein